MKTLKRILNTIMAFAFVVLAMYLLIVTFGLSSMLDRALCGGLAMLCVFVAFVFLSE